MKISFLITLLLATVACTHGQEPVKDTAGNSLETGQQYFIQPIKTGSKNGGGLVPAAIRLIPLCPLGINQAAFTFLPGLPVSFEFSDSVTEPIVKTSTDVTIEFKSSVPSPVCKEYSFIWAVESSSDSNEPAIILGGTPGSQNSRFKIEKAGEGAGENTYKLTSLGGTVGNVTGIFLAPQLVLTNDNAKTTFVKFNKYNEAITSASRVEKSGLRMFPF
ncbi:unnamed protein product [Brassica rapa]|uniref:Uncharacterized protein n=2 Tax=Brassica TaxID=3705 RepID=A0A3P6AFV2_BRACM|nr:unnamed protein product [Brassica napus]CAG7893389.1 unnamed protein product [Brassica rapa]VDC88475.1 unnamed protein product [Brassica rapa]